MDRTHRARKELKPPRLPGIGDELMAQHWELYEGYVKQANLLEARLGKLAAARDFGAEFAGLKRQWAFEYDGMILHELYFGILRPKEKQPGFGDPLNELMREAFGSFDAWKDAFTAVGLMRGAGWAVLYYEPGSRRLENHVIGSHEVGHPPGCVPIVVMDVWEHAYVLDQGATGRAAYVAAFLKNVDWRKAEQTLRDAMMPA